MYALILKTITSNGHQIRYKPDSIAKGFINDKDEFMSENNMYISITNGEIINKLKKESYLFTFTKKQLIDRYGDLCESALLKKYLNEVSHCLFINFRGQLCLEYYYNRELFYCTIDFDDPFYFNKISMIEVENEAVKNRNKKLIYFPRKVG